MNDIDNINLLEFKLTDNLIDNLFCHVCGSRRKRNLIVSYTAKRGKAHNLFIFHLLGESEIAFKEGLCDRHVICYRCSMLELSDDAIKYLADRYFGSPKYRYKNQSQKNATMRSKRIE